MAKYGDIPKLPQAHYEIDVEWGFLAACLTRFTEGYQLDMNPDFQRGHVWTIVQQRAYIEWILMGGESGKVIFFNCPGWQCRAVEGPMVLVDGKQRIEAVLGFLRDEVLAFGYLKSQYIDRLRIVHAGFKVRVAALDTRADVLRWYLAINAGGTPHSKRELDRVRAMLAKEVPGELGR